MANYYCTLFDSNYLARGLALYKSLKQYCTDALLYVYCFDELSYEVLVSMNISGLSVIRLSEFESDELLSIKAGRTRGEYCWTCTPHIIRDCIKKFGLPMVTYLDADLFFFGSPSVLMEEFQGSGSSVLITEHRYTKRYDKSEFSGIYCVQYMTFKNDARGLNALNWWCDKTIEWCFNRYEDGKFGDQKYLDDWRERFEGIHVLEYIGGGVAPWNIQQYKIGNDPSVNGFPIVFYHFHNLKWRKDGAFMLDAYRINDAAIEWIYKPYIQALRDGMAEVCRFFPGFDKGIDQSDVQRESVWRIIENRLKGKFRVIQ